MNQARYDPLAEQDIVDIVEIVEFYLEQARNPRAGDAFLQELDRNATSYARQPTMGDIRDDLGEHLRSFTFRRWYVAVYEPIDDGIRVIRDFDGRRDYGPLVSDSGLE